MKNGYKIEWSQHANDELDKIINYLENHWNQKVINKFLTELEKTLTLISINPFLFQESYSKTQIRRAVILSLNSLY
jgi:plasmid stabilization system protein ParE